MGGTIGERDQRDGVDTDLRGDWMRDHKVGFGRGRGVRGQECHALRIPRDDPRPLTSPIFEHHLKYTCLRSNPFQTPSLHPCPIHDRDSKKRSTQETCGSPAPPSHNTLGIRPERCLSADRSRTTRQHSETGEFAVPFASSHIYRVCSGCEGKGIGLILEHLLHIPCSCILFFLLFIQTNITAGSSLHFHSFTPIPIHIHTYTPSI